MKSDKVLFVQRTRDGCSEVRGFNAVLSERNEDTRGVFSFRFAERVGELHPHHWIWIRNESTKRFQALVQIWIRGGQ